MPDATEPVLSQLEGWVTGLQMMALASAGGPAKAEGSDRATVIGRQRFITDYVRQKVPAKVPDERFILNPDALSRRGVAST